jgi:hypothetical protein
MGFTNRSKTNVARSESWTPAAALQNRLKKLEEEICCLTPALYGGTGFVQRTITTAELGSALALTGLNTDPILLVPGVAGKILFPKQLIVTFTCTLQSFSSAGIANDDFQIKNESGSITLPYYLFRNSLSTTSTRTLSSLALTSSPFIGNVSQVASDDGLLLYSNGNATLLPGGDLELEILLWYDIITFTTP